MEKELADLKEKMINLMNGYKDGSVTDDNSTPYINDIILAGAEVYKNTGIMLYAPLNHGEAMAYETDGEYFIPLFTSMENHEGIEEYRPVSLHLRRSPVPLPRGQPKEQGLRWVPPTAFPPTGML